VDQDMERLLKFARDELQVLAEQGCDTWEWERRIAQFGKEPGPDPLRGYEELWKGITSLVPAEDFPYDEPSGLEDIRARRPDGPRRIAVAKSQEELADRTLGAWTGRIAGCMLGKPVEGWPRDRIRDLLDMCGVDRLEDYIPPPPEDRPSLRLSDHARSLLRDRIDMAVRDDDVDYTIAGLCIVEEHGRDFTPRHVAEYWLRNLPHSCTYSAERAAYRNFVNDIWPPESATHRNPYREWIGAQIRADGFGYACPGRPEQAAELAFKDACISHVRNGIYGEMWVAAMLAAAFVADDVEKVVRIGLTEIPAACRLTEAIDKVLAWRAEGISDDEVVTRLLEEFDRYHPVHTINNAAIVAMALLWGEKDFSRTVGLAVEAGLDTDCNGATAGSVLGAIVGESGIPAHWKDPLNDRVGTALAWQSDLTITGLAERTRRVQGTD